MKKIIKKFYEHNAYNALASEDYEKSGQYFKKILNLFPFEKGANYNYAVSLIGAGKYNKAEIFLRKELDISGEKFEILRALGDVYYLNDKRLKARSFIKMAIKRCPEPKEMTALKKKLGITSDKKKYKLMLKGYSLYEKGTLFLQNNEWHKAQALFLEAADYDRYNPFIYNNLGVISMMYKKNYTEAKKYFDKALEHTDLLAIKNNYQKAKSLIKKDH